MKTILIATDGSEAAGQALDVAIDLAKETEPHDPDHIAHAAAQRAREAGLDATPHGAHDDVVTCIVDAATALGADLLVVGSRGLGSLSGAVLGSVSHALIGRSPVPVTIVRHAPVRAAAGS